MKQVSLSGESITILIAHRLSTILILEKSKIVETGDHEALVAHKGLYYAMGQQ